MRSPTRPIALILAVGGLVLAACAPAAEPSPEPTRPAAPAATVPEISASPTVEPTPVPQVTPGLPLTDEEATELMYTLLSPDRAAAQEALNRVLESGDQRFIAVLIELLRGNQLGIVRGAGVQEHVAALDALSGSALGYDWPGWIEWYGATELVPPPGFTGWKGQMLSKIDPGFADFLRDDLPAEIRVEEIQWGGVLIDGIPALDNATMIPAGQADYLSENEPVFGITINGDSRAYPLRIMDWHEMANDVVGGVPVSLAYCTLCGAGIAYDGRAPDGNTYTFGSSGFLFRSNKLMYDRQTRALWNQLTGRPVLGELVQTGAGAEPLQLELLPVVLTSWAEWWSQHPDTVVLDINTGFDRDYTLGAAYGDYFASSGTMFPVWERSDLLEDKARVYSLQIGGTPKAYPLALLAEEGVVNDTLAGTPVVLVAGRGIVDVRGHSQFIGTVSYEAGGEVRAFERGTESFSPGEDPDTVLDSAGRAWQVTEEALVGPDGEQLARINGHLAYWFGWFAMFPGTELYGQSP